MLQNDMGNTLIQDSATGNIMGLSPGFIPTGIKEHGGIMYITSVNKEGKGEIGTIPSPIIRDIYKDKIVYGVQETVPIEIGDPLTISNKLYPADKFIVNLEMEIDPTTLVGERLTKDSDLSGPENDPSDIILKREVLVKPISGQEGRQSTSIYTPLITYAHNLDEHIIKESINSNHSIELFSTKGLYSLNLYTSNENGVFLAPSSLLSPQNYEEEVSDYWYLHTNDISSIFPKDLMEATLNNALKQFPSQNKPGKLAIKLMPESMGGFGILPRKNDPKNTPITLKSIESNGTINYKSFFPGFYYSTESGIYVDKINSIRIIDESTGRPVNLVSANAGPNPSQENKNTTTLEYDFGRIQEVAKTSIYDAGENFSTSRHVFYWKDWDGNILGLPQAQSINDSNTFILSNIPDIYDHTQTNFESSTKDLDEKIHTGLFYADLGNKYNNWYRLELDYYDQYDIKQGNFSTRFNPYLNDVFGTNLGITEIEMADALVMGEKVDKTLEKTLKNVIYSIDNGEEEGVIHQFPKHPGDPNNEDYKELEGWDHRSPGDYHNSEFVQEGRYDLEYNAFYATRNPYLIADLKDSKLDFDYNLMYLYQYDLNTKECTLKASNQIEEETEINQYFQCDFGTIYYSALGDSSFTEFEKIPQPDGSTKDLRIFYNGNYYGFEKSVLDGRGSKINIGENQSAIKTWYKLNELETSFIFNDIQDKSKLKLKVGINQTVNMIPTLFPVIGINDIRWYIKPTDEGRNSNLNLRTEMELYNFSSDAQIDIPFKHYPQYKIVPYFLLKGKDENNKINYVQRFDYFTKDEDTEEIEVMEMVHRSNLELISLLNTRNSDLRTPNNSSYIKDVIITSESIGQTIPLTAGVYVINITKVPGENSDENIRLSITCDDKHWVYTKENIIQQGASIGELIFDFFEPIILVLPELKPVHFTTSEFKRQKIGLYKIDNIEPSDLINISTVSSCTYSEYMREVVTRANEMQRQSERYEFIQKYGAFFKEAYVFSDGLISTEGTDDDESMSLESVSILDLEKTYNPNPYIPNDPSIFPLKLVQNSNGEYNYVWNIYCMPYSILTSSNSQDFIFTNKMSLDESILNPTTDPGHLRRRNYLSSLEEIEDIMQDKFPTIGNGGIIDGEMVIT